jgi:hypothetical protein
VQYAINPIALQAPWGRFEGMTGNPQHAAAYLALAIPSLLYLLRRTGEPLLFRMVWAGLLLAAALVLLWTGSRTGAVMTCVSVLVMFRRKLWVIVPCVTVTFLTMAFGGEEVDNTLVEQYGDRGDTRTANWLLMLNQFLAEPAFGRTDFENAINYKESSWLAMAAATGVIGLGALVFATYILARYLWFVAARPRPPHVRGLSDLVLATFLGLFVGSFFEAYLIGTITFPVYVTYLMFGVMNWVLEWRPAATPPQPAPPAPA